MKRHHHHQRHSPRRTSSAAASSSRSLTASSLPPSGSFAFNSTSVSSPSSRTTREGSSSRFQYPQSTARSLPENVLRGMTINKLRFSALEQHLYGRQEQIHALNESFQAISCRDGKHKKELVLVAGISGTGKTELAASLKRTVQQQSQGGAEAAFFMLGKCDLQRRVEPYVVFVGLSTALQKPASDQEPQEQQEPEQPNCKCRGEQYQQQ